jgi:hypothetical protein
MSLLHYFKYCYSMHAYTPVQHSPAGHLLQASPSLLLAVLLLAAALAAACSRCCHCCPQWQAIHLGPHSLQTHVKRKINTAVLSSPWHLSADLLPATTCQAEQWSSLITAMQAQPHAAIITLNQTAVIIRTVVIKLWPTSSPSMHTPPPQLPHQQ